MNTTKMATTILVTAPTRRPLSSADGLDYVLAAPRVAPGRRWNNIPLPKRNDAVAEYADSVRSRRMSVGSNPHRCIRNICGHAGLTSNQVFHDLSRRENQRFRQQGGMLPVAGGDTQSGVSQTVNAKQQDRQKRAKSPVYVATVPTVERSKPRKFVEISRQAPCGGNQLLVCAEVAVFSDRDVEHAGILSPISQPVPVHECAGNLHTHSLAL